MPDNETKPATTVTTSLDDDTLYGALAATPRRRVLFYLIDHPRSSLEELATVLSGWEAVDSGRAKTPAHHDNWKTDLYHMHLPLLADAGLVSFDTESGTVELGNLDPAVSDLVESAVAAEDE